MFIYNLNISVDLLSWSVWQKVTSICLKNLSQATSQPMRFSTRVSTPFTLNLLHTQSSVNLSYWIPIRAGWLQQSVLFYCYSSEPAGGVAEWHETGRQSAARHASQNPLCQPAPGHVWEEHPQPIGQSGSGGGSVYHSCYYSIRLIILLILTCLAINHSGIPRPGRSTGRILGSKLSRRIQTTVRSPSVPIRSRWETICNPYTELWHVTWLLPFSRKGYSHSRVCHLLSCAFAGPLGFPLIPNMPSQHDISTTISAILSQSGMCMTLKWNSRSCLVVVWSLPFLSIFNFAFDQYLYS